MANKIYLYKARFDKTSVEILATFPYSGYFAPTRINNLGDLNLSEENYSLISSKQKENYLKNELMVESAETFENFKTSLQSRGFKKLPISSSPTLDIKGGQAIQKIEKKKFDGKVVKSRKTMLRRKF